MAIGGAVTSADASAFLVTDASGNLDTIVDADPAAPVVIGRLKLGATSGTADHVYLSHFDLATSATTYQIRLDPDGDTNLQAIGVGSSITINPLSNTGLVALQGNSQTRFSCNNTGIGFFGTAPTARSTGWSITNPVSRKTFDPATVTLPELGEAVGSVIVELLAKGFLAA
jgi:hypothetical protein